MHRFIWALLLMLCFTSLWGQRYKERHIRKDLAQLEGFENAFLGFALYDPEKNKILAEQFADKHMTPASNTKLFTFYATQKFFKENLPALEYVIRDDSLIFWSTGYPLTLHPDHPDRTVIDFLSKTKKDLYYWPRPIEDGRYGPGWSWDDFGGYYGAEKSAFPIYGSSIQFIVDNAKQTVQMQPEHPGLKVKVSNELSNRARIQRDEFWNEFEVRFDSTINYESPIDTLVIPFRFSDQLFIELLGSAIGKDIEKIDAFERPLSFELVSGAKTDSLFKWMLQPSDNLFAESLLLMASGSFSDTLSSSAFIKQVNESLLAEPDGPTNDPLVWVDGSGLSRYNMFTPNEMIEVLERLYSTYSEERLFNLLPQGGLSGTLEEWYAGANGEPFVFAKTGTLSNNHTLSGFIKTKKGKTLLFSIMANHYTCPTKQIRENFGLILEKIRRAY